VLFARNVDSSAQLRELTRQLHEDLPVRPFIAIDQEARRVNRLRSIVGELPGIEEVKRTNTAREFGRQIGRSLREHGIDLDFAPVLDLEVFDGCTDNALRDRCWGRSHEEVTHRAGEFIDGLTEAGVQACGKHFPGLGASQHDSHEQLPTIARSRDRLLAEDVQPFRRLSSRLPAIMVSHGHYTAFDGKTPQPASLSAAIVTGLLREQLGFTGVIFTDDMEMGAITQCGSFADSVAGAVQAGADVVLVCHTPEKIMTAYETLARMKIPAESHERIRRLQSLTHELVR
jgi:beta-N-acetylhexosaminidase